MRFLLPSQYFRAWVSLWHSKNSLVHRDGYVSKVLGAECYRSLHSLSFCHRQTETAERRLNTKAGEGARARL